MKCAFCHEEIGESGMVITDVTGGATYTATLHRRCVDALVGPANTRKLRSAAFTSGWVQTGLPAFGENRRQAALDGAEGRCAVCGRLAKIYRFRKLFCTPHCAAEFQEGPHTTVVVLKSLD
jgi:hypothetical protein